MDFQKMIDLNNLGLSLMKQGNLIDAAKVFEKIMAIDPAWEHGIAAYSLACCYEDLHRLLDAERMYLYALDQEPGNYYYLGAYASFLYLYGEPCQALRYYFKHLKLDNYRQEIVEECMPALLALGQKLGLAESDIHKMLDDHRKLGKNDDDFSFVDKQML